MQLSYFEFWQHDNLAWLDFTLESSVDIKCILFRDWKFRVLSSTSQAVPQATITVVSLGLSASALTVHCPVWRVKTEAKKYVWSWGDIASSDWTYWGQGHGNVNIIVCSSWLLFSEVTSFLIVEKVNVWSLQLHVTEQLLTLGNVLEILKLEILAETCDGGRVNWCQTLDMWE